MKTTFLLTFVSLCLWTANASAVAFPNASVTDGICVDADYNLTQGQANLLHAAGVTTVRAAFYGYVLKDAQGNMQYGTYDNFVTTCRRRVFEYSRVYRAPSMGRLWVL